MSRFFNRKVKNRNNKVFKLKKTIYGLRHSPCAFCNYLTAELEACGSAQSKLDP